MYSHYHYHQQAAAAIVLVASVCVYVMYVMCVYVCSAGRRDAAPTRTPATTTRWRPLANQFTSPTE